MKGFGDHARAGAQDGLDHDEEMMFRIQARRNRLLGQWAAVRMGLDQAETESYARSVVQAEFEESGDEDVIRKVLGDILQSGVDVTEAEVRTSLSARTVEAKRQLMGDS
ncbi:DUF1476 domain-containing protein [Novosphingobium sp.]|uniref:DUF1476 domain-containing protein n=1 Tax=Novosphingobium sp. TaxID=1874826 RepID=UPI003D09DACD